jgi:hypothetical protein
VLINLRKNVGKKGCKNQDLVKHEWSILQRSPAEKEIQTGVFRIIQSIIFALFQTVAIAQLVRASDCGSEGRRFEPG